MTFLQNTFGGPWTLYEKNMSGVCRVDPLDSKSSVDCILREVALANEALRGHHHKVNPVGSGPGPAPPTPLPRDETRLRAVTMASSVHGLCWEEAV